MRKSLVATLTILLIVICALGINALSNDEKRKKSCQLPRNFKNGRLRTLKRETRGMPIVPEGSALQFKCNNLHVLRGPSRVVCKGGTWIPSLPKCFANSKEVCDTCCTMPNFTNGQASTIDVATRGLLVVPEYSVLQLSCDDGHEFFGTGKSLCLQGTWLPGLPLCTRNGCFPPPLLEHGKTISIGQESIYPSGTNVSYECNEGYKIDQQSPLICLRVDKEWIWTGEVPRCQVIVECEDPGEDSNGQRDGSCCQSGDVLSYSCIEEYEIIGPSAIICTEGGIWNSTRPKCQPEVFCSVPDRITNGKIVGKKHSGFYLPDDEIYIVCDEGYTVGNQSDYLYCKINGHWDEDIPECKSSVNCNMPVEPENGYIYELANDRNLTTFPYNFEINFVCHKGYKLIGNSWRSCGSYGWTTQAPVCEEIQCPDPGMPENGRVLGSNYSIGSIIEFGCYSGYQLLGSPRRVCMENGQWSGELSRCDRGGNYCPNPGTPIGGTKFGNRYDFGSNVTFHCNPGRILIGSAHRICQRNGVWSGEETKCLSQYDFDDKRVVGARIKSLLTEEKLNQEVKVNNYMSQVESNDTDSDDRGRAIDLNYPGRLIFIFIFDVSGSVGKRNFERSIDFAKAMVKMIKVSEDGTRVGAITFSSAASTEFNPFDYNNMEGVLEALDNLEYKKGGTATSSALTLIKENMMPLSLEVLGKNSKIIVFLMTDGKANMAGDPTHDAKELKEIGVEIYCVGITGDRKMETLNGIATSKEEHVFILDSYDSMDWLVQQIVNDTVDYSQCGIRQWAVVEVEEEDARGRVVNGLAVTKSWPWMAAILFVDPVNRDSSKPLGLCGGSIIAPNWILTAAHCMYDRKRSVWREKNELIINLGIINLRDTRNAQERLVLRYTTHPSYDIKTFDNDIALIELNKPAKYNEFVRPVCLPPSESDLHKEPTFYRAGQRAAVVGWGYDKALIESKARDAHHIKESKWLVLTLQSRETCEDSLRTHPDYFFTKQMICAGGDGKDVCHGDSGGPMMQNLINDIGEPYWTEVGIVSWGIGCAQPNTYGFYTKVSMFVDWIKETIKK